MDLNTVRILVMLVALFAYLVIVLWAYAPSRQKGLEAEAERILQESDA
jgi:hypothetical protein